MRLDRDYVSWAWPSTLSLFALLAASGSKLWLLSLLFLLFVIPLPRQVMAHGITMPRSPSSPGFKQRIESAGLQRQIDLVIFPAVALVALLVWMFGGGA